MSTRPAISRKLFLAFAAVSVSFLGATAYVHWRSMEIGVRAQTLIGNALPSIEHLRAAGRHVRAIEGAATEYGELAVEARPAARELLAREWVELDRELTAYLKLPTFEGEHEIYERGVPSSLRALDAAASRLLARVEVGQTLASRELGYRDVRVAANQVSRELGGVVELNAEQAMVNARHIEEVLGSAAVWAVVLDSAAVFVGVLAALWVLRVVSANEGLQQRHNALVVRRASELELFGTRVAHDLLSPLSALTFCLGAFKRVSQADPALQEALVRAKACVVRAQRMVDGIFEFARSGGAPAPGARADLREIAEQVAEEVQASDARDRPEVVIEPFAPWEVACSPGVLVSLLSNLLRNAAKYMSDSAVKRITVRAFEEKGGIRVEVEDTGPGVPAGLEAVIFEPYVRADGLTQAGLGLGLATVRRLCAAHGGACGVVSTSSTGSIFWMSLPKAERVAEAAPRESGPSILVARGP